MSMFAAHEGKKKYVMARISGGLGNQLFTYATMMKIADATGRKIVLDSSEYALVRDRKFGLLDFAEPAESMRAGPVCRMLSRVSCILEHFGFMRTSACLIRIFGWKRFSFDVLRPFDEDKAEFASILECKSHVVYLTGCCQRLPLIADRDSVRVAFAPVVEQQSTIGQGESVSIHVRRGDYLKIGGGAWALGESYYKRAIAMIREKIAHPSWYVFSDDIAWCREAFVDLKGAVFVDGDVDHPYRDLLRMAQCKHHVIANSTFSWWGAYLSPHIGHVVYPNVWVAGVRTDLTGLMPEEWILAEVVD